MNNTAEQSWDEDSPDQLGHSLPGNKRVWEQSPLGMPETWSEALTAYSRTIQSFAYPACVFWGQKMAIMHNHEWSGASDIRGQGQEQHGMLPAEAFNALSASLYGGVPKILDSHALLRDNCNDKAAHYTVLISPLFAGENSREDSADGSLVQLIPKPDLYDPGQDGQAVFTIRQSGMQQSGRGLRIHV